MKIQKVFRKACDLMSIPFVNQAVNITASMARITLEKYSPDMKSSCFVNCETLRKRKVQLTIIIPAYNMEKYIKACIDSVLEQITEYIFEVIVINDGSTDNTGQILEQYNSINHVRIVSQPNRGFSGARNTGIDLADGEYLMFVDVDDKLLPGAIECLMKKAKDENADVVAGSFIKVFENGKRRNGVQYATEEVRPMNLLYGMPWGKVYKHELFTNLRFPEGYWYEDSIFAHIVWPMCRTCYTLQDNVYEYTINTQGITYKSAGQRKSIDSLYIMDALLKDRKKFGLEVRQADYEYFLRMIKLTYRRTKLLDKEIKMCIFIVQCSLYKTYYRQFKTNRKLAKLEKALAFCDYKLYLWNCEMP